MLTLQFKTFAHLPNSNSALLMGNLLLPQYYWCPLTEYYWCHVTINICVNELLVIPLAHHILFQQSNVSIWRKKKRKSGLTLQWSFVCDGTQTQITLSRSILKYFQDILEHNYCISNIPGLLINIFNVMRQL